MSVQTENLGLYTWLENDPVDFEEINANFETIDELPICIESGTVSGNYQVANLSATPTTWYYRKYSDGTVDMCTSLQTTNIRCNQSDTYSPPYYSGDVYVNFPFELSSVYNLQTHLASNTRGWVCDTTSSVLPATLSNGMVGFKFILLNEWQENDYTQEIYKQIFISVKGVLD